MQSGAVVADPDPQWAAASEFDFTVEDFERVRGLIYRHAGISLSPAKRQLAYSRLARRLRALRLSTFRAYLDALERDERPEEWQEFVNALTTNLTSFFREPHHFPLLAEHLRRARAPVRIWCSAASTGEEPYSIAMTAMEALGNSSDVEIVASDIDTQCLRTAAEGRYREQTIERLPLEQRRRFFLRGKAGNEGWVRIKPEVRALVRFERINLLSGRYPFQDKLDVIFCHNVMIYFDKPTQLAVLERFAPLLKPDGLLFCGHSENFMHARSLFRLRGKTVYELAKGGAR